MIDDDIKVTQRAKLRASDVEAAIRRASSTGGNTLVNAVVFVDVESGTGERLTNGRPDVKISMNADMVDLAIVGHLASKRLVPTSPIVWGVDEGGIFAACDVEPKPRKTRASKGA